MPSMLTPVALVAFQVKVSLALSGTCTEEGFWLLSGGSILDGGLDGGARRGGGAAAGRGGGAGAGRSGGPRRGRAGRTAFPDRRWCRTRAGWCSVARERRWWQSCRRGSRRLRWSSCRSSTSPRVGFAPSSCGVRRVSQRACTAILDSDGRKFPSRVSIQQQSYSAAEYRIFWAFMHLLLRASSEGEARRRAGGAGFPR